MKRIVTEGAAIVVSILIAFWIDAWWQERSEKIALIEYLVHFENEIIENEKLIDSHAEGIARDLVSLHRVLLAISDDDQQTLPESFMDDLGNALWVRSPAVSKNAFEDLASSGNLRFVRDAKVIRVMNEYQNRADYLDSSYDFLNSIYLDQVLPTISPYIALSSLGWHEYETHLAPNGENTGVTPDSPFSTNVTGLRSLDVWNTLFNWKSGKIDESNSLKEMKRTGLELRDLVRAEIEYQSQ